MKRTIIVVAAAGLALAGCSGRGSDNAADNAAENATGEAEAPDLNVTQEAPPPPASNQTTEAKVVAPPPEAPLSRDAQVLDDAAATGMTARLPRDDAASPAPPANASDGSNASATPGVD